MVIALEYKGHALFDIEWWLHCDDSYKTAERWYSKINSSTCVEGITRFLQDKLKEDNFDVEEFITLSKGISRLAGWLWELHKNYPVNRDRAEERHYHQFDPELMKIINQYCDKYGLSKHID